jgi:hypothetical protein
MRKYAAPTAMAIALITMLALTVSASAQRGYNDIWSHCRIKCNTELWNTAKLWDHTSFIRSKPLLDACTAKCVAAKEAAQD